LKRLLSGSSTLFRFVSGGLILFVIFLLFRKKKAIPNPTKDFNIPGLSPSTNSNSAEEIYNLIRKEEGINFKAKRDGSDKNGNPLFTIGIGHQIQPGEEDLLTATITEEEAINLYKKDIKKILDDMNKNIKVPLNKNQQLALISLRYRIGPTYFNSSTLLKLLNQGNYQKASEEFKNWRLSDGKINQVLVARAERERLRFVTPVNGTNSNLPSKADQERCTKKFPNDPKKQAEYDELCRQLKIAEEILEKSKKNLGKPIPPKSSKA